MEFGLTIFATDKAMNPVELAREAEARGFASLWLPEHTHIPASRATPFPGGTDLPEMYYRSMDTPTVLAACAAATETIRLGAGIWLAAQHEPLDAAKRWATLDLLSNGRARFGVGFGWNIEEMNHHDVEYSTRRAHVRESVLAMQALWTQETASFDGDHISFEASYSWPKPVQQPRIPTYIGGGAGPKMFAHVSEYADGWIPIGGAGIRSSLGALHEAWAEAGRDGKPDVIPFGTIPNEGKIELYRELGCTEVVLNLPSADRDAVLRKLDDYAAFL